MRNLTLSKLAEPEEDEPGFLFALVLNFLPPLGATTKGKKKKKKRAHTHTNQGQTALRRARDKITCNFEKLYDT